MLEKVSAGKFADCSAEVSPLISWLNTARPARTKVRLVECERKRKRLLSNIRACNPFECKRSGGRRKEPAPAEKHQQSAGEVAEMETSLPTIRSLHEPLHGRRDMILRSHARR